MAVVEQDRLAETRLVAAEAVRRHRDELAAVRAALAEESQLLHERLEQIGDNLRGLDREIGLLEQVAGLAPPRDTVPVPPAEPTPPVERSSKPVAVGITFEQARDAAYRLREFGASDLGRELGVTPGTGAHWIRRLLAQGTIADHREEVRRGGKARIYRVVKPSDGKPEQLPPKPKGSGPRTSDRVQAAPSGNGARAGNKNTSEILRAASRAGAIITKRGNGHWLIQHKGKQATIASSPSDDGAADRRVLRDIGIEV